jgi:hypothetical protein
MENRMSTFRHDVSMDMASRVIDGDEDMESREKPKVTYNCGGKCKFSFMS